MEVTFNYKFSKNYISFKLHKDTNEVWMENVCIDYDYPKIFFLLLRNAINKFIEDEYKFFVQTILKEDMVHLDKDKWIIVNNDNESPIINIKCPIEEAIFNIARGLGISEN